MAITRRQFLKRGGAAAAGAFLAPRVFGSPFVQEAFANIGNRYFVVLFLDGGNDGLNTVVPEDGTLRGFYENARGTGPGGIRIATSDLQNTLIASNPGGGGQLALHPGFRAPGTAGDGGLWQLYQDGDVAVMQGCGYPDYTLSHEESRVIWQSGDPFLQTYSGTGWVGRHFTSASPVYTGSDIPGVVISDSVAHEFRQTGTSVLAVRNLDDFGFPYDSGGYQDKTAKDACFNALHNFAIGSTPAGFKYVGNTGKTTLTSTNAYPGVGDDYDADSARTPFRNRYDAAADRNAGVGVSTARDLREIAKVIYGAEAGDVSSRFFWLSNGGYDTHSDQGAGEAGGQHYSLHQEVGRALKIFRDDLQDMGVWDRTCVLVFSEFSRRVGQNDNGTDHGSQGPVFVVGGKVNGGVYGFHPNIDDLDGEGNTIYHQDNDGFRSTDFRDVYGTILKHWMAVPQGTILSNILQVDSGPASERWTVPNFDLVNPQNAQALFQP